MIATCELIAHFPRAFHEVLILGLLKPAFFNSQLLANLRALLLPVLVFCLLLFLLVNLLHRKVLNRSYAELRWLLPRFKRLLRRLLSQMVLVRHLFLSKFLLQSPWCGKTNNILN